MYVQPPHPLPVQQRSRWKGVTRMSVPIGGARLQRHSRPRRVVHKNQTRDTVPVFFLQSLGVRSGVGAIQVLLRERILGQVVETNRLAGGPQWLRRDFEGGDFQSVVHGVVVVVVVVAAAAVAVVAAVLVSAVAIL